MPSGGASNFSIFLPPQAGHDGNVFAPKAIESSKTFPHFSHWKSNVGMEGYYRRYSTSLKEFAAAPIVFP
jgi:hypothetical protein